MKRLLSVALVVLMLLTALCSCSFLGSIEREFKFDELSITMTAGHFSHDSEEEEGYKSWSYVSSEGDGVIVEKLEREYCDEELAGYTAAQMAAFFAEDSGVSATTKEGLPFYTYDVFDDEENEDYSYDCYVYESDEAFYIVTFCCDSKDHERFDSKFIKMAKSVKFAEADTEE